MYFFLSLLISLFFPNYSPDPHRNKLLRLSAEQFLNPCGKTQTFNFTFNESKHIKWALMVLSACCLTRWGSEANRRICDGRATPGRSTAGWRATDAPRDGEPWKKSHERWMTATGQSPQLQIYIHHNKGGAAQALSWLEGNLVWQRSGSGQVRPLKLGPRLGIGEGVQGPAGADGRQHTPVRVRRDPHQEGQSKPSRFLAVSTTPCTGFLFPLQICPFSVVELWNCITF